MSPAALSPAAGTSGSPAPALQVSDLTKTFVGGRALDAVDLQVAAGQVHALLGENGSGKSTLIKVLSGYHRPDPGGLVRIGGSELAFGSTLASYETGARFVHQDLGLIESSSISDNLAFGPGFPTRWGRSGRGRHGCAPSRHSSRWSSMSTRAPPSRRCPRPRRPV